MRVLLNRRAIPAVVAALAVSAIAAGVPRPAHAASQPAGATRPVTVAAAATNGKIAYSCFKHGGSVQSGWVVASSTGAGKVFTAWTRGGFGGSAQWSPDGTELVHSASFNDPTTGKPQRLSIMLSEADGTYPLQLSNDVPGATTADVNPAWLPTGRGLWFARDAAGGAPSVRALGAPYVSNPATSFDNADTPDVALNRDVAYVANGSDVMYSPQGLSTTVKVATGTRPRFTSDGTGIIYVDATSHATLRLTNLTGATNTIVGTIPSPGPITDFAVSPDGSKVLVAGPKQVWVEDFGTGLNRALVGGYECAGGSPQVSWQPVPVTPAQVVRVAGADRVGTSIAVSKASIADGSADAVVLADSMHFPDALAGTPLAAKEHGPLLLTNGSKAAPDPRVMTEIARVLKAPSKLVFVLGGTGSVSQGIEDALTAAGYSVVRFAGSDRYNTALKIAQFLGSGATAPQFILLATGTDFPDGLSAGAAAARYYSFGAPPGAALLLTDGAQLPPGVQSYIATAKANRPGGVLVWTIGGLAARAYPTADSAYVGVDRYQTSLLVAEHAFGVTSKVALATGLAFPDALSGGVYAGTTGAPLLLAPTSLVTTGAVPSYLHAWSSGIDTGVIFGGTAVVSSTVETQLAHIIGLSATCTLDTDTGAGPPKSC